ncbi:hypothetical protein Airi01_030490 [Actinoallomurus iriomotensis]|uniref:AAA+ ATPase domain-containing protein n=1 Tax=Actinoallomurus iriomotensis TaxID=478107 RepID=A0A9W6VPT6_9ACTN|nr:hypothetical protein Airi01_030490 [Actinoallomurus iriomotensis]
MAERDTRAMVSSGWWSGTPPQQRQHLIAGRMLALPDGSWWIFGAWGRWYRLTPADAQWHLCPPPQLAMTRRSARPLQQGMPVPPVPPHVVPTGPDLAYAPPPALAFVDAGIRPEVTSRVRAIVESAAALPTHDYPHWWGLFSSGVPSTVAVTWGVMLWCATAPVFDARIDAQLLSLWSSHRTRPLPDIDGPRWLTPPPLEALVGLYTERLRSGRVDAAVVILRTMWAMAGALREDSRFQARADALIAMLGVTLQNPTVDYGALSYGDQAVVQQWLTRCPPALAPALRVEASTGEHFRNSYYDLALAVTPIAGDPGSRGYVEPRLIAAALLAADLAVVRQDVSGQVIGWLDPQVSDAMRAMLIQRDHPLRPFWPEGDRLPRSLRDGIEAAEPAVRGALLATMYAADLAWCRLGGGIPARPRGFPSSVAILAEIIGPSRATSATASEPVSHTPGIAPLAHQYPSNPGASPQTPGVPLAQQPPTGPPGQAPAWTPPAPGGGAAGAPPATEAWDAAQPWPADPGRETPKSGPPPTEAWQGASGLPANTPPRTEAWPGTDPAPASPPGTAGGETPSSPPPTEAWSATEGADPHPAAHERYGPGAQPLPPRTQAWPGTDPAGKPSPPPATQAWPGTDPGSGGGSGSVGEVGSPPATQAWPGADPGSGGASGGAGKAGSPPATQAWPGTDPGSDRRPGGVGEVGSPPATQAWPGTDPGSGQGSGGAGKAGSPPATQAWPGADPGSGAGQGFGGVGSPPTTQADVGTDPGSGVGLGPAGRGETAPAGEVGPGSGSESREAGTVPPATLVEPVSDDSGSSPAAAPGTGADTPAPPPATQAWPGTGDEHAGASGTEAQSPDPAALTSSTEPSEEPPPAGGLTPPHAAQARPSTDDATGGPPPAPQAQPGGHTATSTSELNAEGADGGASASSSASEAGTGGAAVGGSGVSSAPAGPGAGVDGSASEAVGAGGPGSPSASRAELEGADGGAPVSPPASEVGTGGAAVGGSGVSSASAGPGVGVDGSGSPRGSRAEIEGADGGALVSPRASEVGAGGAAVGGSGLSSAPAGPGAGVDGSASEAVGAGGPASLSATQADEGSASEPLAGAPNAAGEGSGPQGGATSGGGDANGLTSSAARPDTGEHQAEASGRPATRAWSDGDGDGSGSQAGVAGEDGGVGGGSSSSAVVWQGGDSDGSGAQAGVAGADGGVGGGSSSSAVAWSGGDSGGSGSQAGAVGGDEDSGGLTSPSAADVSPGEGGASAGGSDGTSVPAVQSGAGEDGVGGTPPAAQAGTGESATGPGAPIAGRPMAEGVSAESPRNQAGVEDSDAGGGSAVAAEQAGAGGGDEGSPSRVRTSSHAEGIGGGHSPTAAPDSGNRAGQTGSPSSDDSAVAPEEVRTESGSPVAGAVGVDRASDDSDPGDDTAEDASDAPSGARIASSASDDASVAQPGVSEAAAAQAGVSDAAAVQPGVPEAQAEVSGAAQAGAAAAQAGVSDAAAAQAGVPAAQAGVSDAAAVQAGVPAVQPGVSDAAAVQPGVPEAQAEVSGAAQAGAAAAQAGVSDAAAARPSVPAAQPGVSDAAAAQPGAVAAQAGGGQGAPAASSGPFAGGAFHNQTIADPIAFQYLGDDATVVDAEGEDDTVDDRALGVTMMDSLEEHVNHATSLDALEQAKNATYLDWITGTRADAGSIPIVLPPTPVPPGPPRTRMIEQQDPQPPERPGTRIMSEADLFGSAPMPERPVEQIAPPPPPAPMPKVAERFGIRFLCGADDATELFDGLHRRGQQPGQQPGQRLALLIVGEPHTGQRRLTRLVARSLAGAGVGDGSVRTADGSELRGDHVTAVTAILRGAGPPLLFERLDRAVLDAADPARVVAAVTGARENKAALIATCDPASYARLPAELTRVFQVFRLPDLTNIQARMALLHVLADERRVTITAAGLDVVRGDLTRLTGHGDLVGARLVEAYLDRAVARHIDRAGAPRDRMVLVPVDFVGVAEEIEPALRPPRDVDGYLRGLEEMVGLDEVKRTVGGLVAEARVAAGRGVRGHGGPGRHLVFLGRPGTGKATVAGLIGGIYAALNLLDTGQLVVRGARDLAGGDTAAKVVASVDQATGGVLFIEDAHLLAHLPAAVEHLSRLMAERRDRFMVICASPPGEMEDFLRANPGFRAEFGAIVEFGEPTERQLVQLFSRLAERDLYMLDEELRVELIDRFAGMRRYPEFAFADTVRRLFDQIVARQAARLAGSRVDPAAVARLTVGDLPEAQAGQLLHELHLDRRRPPHPRPPGGV